eukprot:5002313-Pleurochrysis_carterae.AAC.1
MLPLLLLFDHARERAENGDATPPERENAKRVSIFGHTDVRTQPSAHADVHKLAHAHVRICREAYT